MSNTTIQRRDFLKMTGLSGVGLILGFKSMAEGGIGETAIFNGLSASFNVTPFIIIDTTGAITIFNQKPEMGQGTFQAIPAIIAEELEVSLDAITIKQTSGESFFGAQTAGGSSSVRSGYSNLRKTGAAAREMLLQAAAQQWQVPVGECFAENATVIHKPTGKKFKYGELVETASKLTVPQSPKLKNPADFKILGKSVQRPDVPWKVTGKPIFGIDTDLPGMLYATVERSPIFGSKLVSFDDSAAMKVKGVVKVVKATRVFGKNIYEGVAVVAENYWAALKGRKALKVVWDNQGFETFSSKAFNQKLRDLSKNDGVIAHNVGDFDKAFAESDHKIEAFYETNMVSHSTMEPMNCTVQWHDDTHVEVWVSTQGPNIIKGEIASTQGLKADDIKVNVAFNGGGFGRRLSGDFANEAAGIAKAMGGKPVKTIWTREDDTQMGPFRPMTFSAMKAALDKDGMVTAFQHKVISPSIAATKNAKYDATKADKTMTEGISDQKYEFPNMKNAYVFAETHIPLAPWRSVTSSTLAFSHECFIDELAVAAKKDPFQFRFDMMPKPSDPKKVLMKLKEFSKWDQPLPKGWGRGVAQYEFFAGLAAMVVEVSTKPNGGVKVEKVYCVIDLGTVVNPDTVNAQVEGAVVMGITAATKDEIVFENGKSVQTNFHNNRMMRMNEMPKVETLILADGGSVIKGVGEPGLPPVAPALANAVFAATGKRMRKMPFDLNKLV
jgi:isoquinoline 1-oxidoreductase beta subunit